MRVRSSKMRLFSVDRYIFLMTFPVTGFTYRNLHGFARFPRDSTALVFFKCQDFTNVLRMVKIHIMELCFASVHYMEFDNDGHNNDHQTCWINLSNDVK